METATQTGATFCWWHKTQDGEWLRGMGDNYTVADLDTAIETAMAQSNVQRWLRDGQPVAVFEERNGQSTGIAVAWLSPEPAPAPDVERKASVEDLPNINTVLTLTTIMPMACAAEAKGVSEAALTMDTLKRGYLLLTWPGSGNYLVHPETRKAHATVSNWVVTVLKQHGYLDRPLHAITLDLPFYGILVDLHGISDVGKAIMEQTPETVDRIRKPAETADGNGKPEPTGVSGGSKPREKAMTKAEAKAAAAAAVKGTALDKSGNGKDAPSPEPAGRAVADIEKDLDAAQRLVMELKDELRGARKGSKSTVSGSTSDRTYAGPVRKLETDPKSYKQDASHLPAFPLADGKAGYINPKGWVVCADLNAAVKRAQVLISCHGKAETIWVFDYTDAAKKDPKPVMREVGPKGLLSVPDGYTPMGATK